MSYSDYDDYRGHVEPPTPRRDYSPMGLVLILGGLVLAILCVYKYPEWREQWLSTGPRKLGNNNLKQPTVRGFRTWP